MKIATFDFENTLRSNGYERIIGVDEAGRGPLAGPVVAAACVLRDDLQASAAHPDEISEKLWDFVRDSKTVSEKKRGEVYEFILEKYYVGVGVVSSETIDRMNILEATFLAMKSAVGDLQKVIDLDATRVSSERLIVLVDGNLKIPHFSTEQRTVTKGDQKVKCIAAASLVAKVVRDQKMLAYSEIFPQYGFASHKGYGTKLHMEALKTYGATPIHRKSFAPVRKVL